MRNALVLLVVGFCLLPAAAQAQTRGSVQGFGGFTFGSSSFGGSAVAPSLGGTFTATLTPHIDIVGEGGRLSDIKPPLYELLDFTSVNLRVSAWYAQGGVRFIASPTRVVRPYTEATLGLTRLHAGLSGFGGRTDAVIAAALGFVDRTSPMLGVGGGVVVGVGPMNIDVGYRYKHIPAGGVAAAINGDDPYRVNEARIGIGVRF